MARSIVHRLGKSDDDSVPGFERAAVRCFHDAGRLRVCDRRLAAIYFYGYSVEMWIKAAYFRMLFLFSGLPAKTQIDGKSRKVAVDEWDALGLPRKPSPHDIAGWAELLVAKRTSLGMAHATLLSNEIANRATAVYRNYWREYMRYRSISVNLSEVSSVREEATWFRAHYPQL
jgi:hypothetical protein